jgi:parvulin-like peptidyl-prolyl isomerase
MSYRRTFLFALFSVAALPGLQAACARPGGGPELVTPSVPVDAAPSAPTGDQAPLPGTTQLVAPAPDRIAARHILVAWQGAAAALTSVRRTREEAQVRAQEVLTRVRAGEDFATLARQYSDDPTGPRGGFLGGFGRGVMVGPFEDAAFALPVGGTSGLVETIYGFHVIRREALEEIHVAEILVQWQGLHGSGAKRSKDEARARAEEALARIQAGEAFADVARAFSDGPMATRGGDLGWLTRGQYRPDFEDAAFALEPGRNSGVVETAVGFHVIARIE